MSQSDNSDIEVTGTGGRQKRGKSSWVWDHFSKIENDTKGVCNHCIKQFAIGISAATRKDKGTKSLADHLRTKHSMDPIVAQSIEQDAKARNAKRTKQQKIKDILVAAIRYSNKPLSIP